MRKYFPKKRTTYLIVVIAFLLLLFLGIYKLFFGSTKVSATNATAQELIAEQDNLLTDNLLQKSTAGDGIPDWEKALWGLDPKKTTAPDGTPDAVYIQKKQAELQAASGTTASQNTASTDSSNLSETDKFARQFFATFVALKQSGQVDSSTINDLSESLGQNIVNPDLPDKYSQTDIVTTDGGSVNDQKYYAQVKNLFANYKSTNIGEEIDITASVIGSDSVTLDQKTEAQAELETIASAYEDFAAKLVAIPVPSDLATYSVKIANNSYNTGLSVENLSKAIDDPILGLSGLSQYQQYSDGFISAGTDLKNYISSLSASESSSSSAIINQQNGQ